MLITWNQLLSEINDLFIKITRDKIFVDGKDDFLAHVQMCFKLNHKDDWKYILASEDILEDSNKAIASFLRFGLSGPTKYNDLGEMYLRLYGVLNAAYMQQQAILNLHKFFQCPNLKATKEEISSLEVVSLRHKLAAHSANYNDPESQKMHVLVPVRMELKEFSCSYFNHYDDSYKTTNLKSALETHIELMCRKYLGVVKKTISTTYKNNEDKQEKLLDRVYPFEEMLAGCGLVKSQATGEFRVIELVSTNKDGTEHQA